VNRNFAKNPLRRIGNSLRLTPAKAPLKRKANAVIGFAGEPDFPTPAHIVEAAVGGLQPC